MNVVAIHMATGLGGAFLVGSAATLFVLWLTRRLGVLDRPNERSAHQMPMPTAGGLGVIAGFWAGMVLWIWLGGVVEEVLMGFLGATALLLVLVVDDVYRPLQPLEKMLLILLAVAAWLSYGPRLEWLTLPFLGRVELGIWGWPLTVLWFVYLCNAFNFMDGIDGLSAIQTLCVCFWGGLLLWGLGSLAGPLAWILGAAAGGFLIFNFPSARIFLGDVGALFIGFFVAAFGVLGERAGLPLWVWIVILAVYLYDVNYTLIRRALRGENLLRAHRKHLYQRLHKLGWSHLRINAGAFCISSLMGVGTYGYLEGVAGVGLMVLGGILLIATTAWVEMRDSDFA
jgi:UDP-N-acetylmuramyl pentapeptide phosphotransferase/UDP-N-acetylglucosamine-1-phosphate transferase